EVLDREGDECAHQDDRGRGEQQRLLELVHRISGISDSTGSIAMRSATESTISSGRNGYRSTSARSEMPVITRIVCRPASIPATTSVSMRSPIMPVDSEWAPMRFSAERNIIGFGLPTTYG